MKEIITFFLSGKEYGVDVAYMQGIENYKEKTSIANGPELLDGVVNIRNEIIPVMDIKKRLVLPASEVTDETKYLIFRTDYGQLGCVVDGVSNMTKVEGNDVQTFPSIMQSDQTNYVDFVAKCDNRLIIVINPSQLMSKEDWDKIQTMLKNMEEEND